jgi:predicted homoserine dehydrogenase-like protein
MSRLSTELAKLEATGSPISVGIIGVGRMGKSIGIGSEEIDGIDVTTVADIRPELGEETFEAMGYRNSDIAVVDTVADGERALEDGKHVVTDNALNPSQMSEIDVVIAATGVPQIGAKVAMRSILNGKHVVMLTDETDAVIGPYLSEMAEQAGVVYSGAAGDEPGSIMELYDFADALGFDIIAAGKGKNNPLDREATPESLKDEAEEKNLNPEIYTAFVDGTNSMLEMTMVANATGLSVDQRGMHGQEVSDVAELADVFNSSAEDGILSDDGVVDFALGGGVAPGVFVVITTDNETIQTDLDYLHMGEGPNYVLHRTYHIPTIEPLLTAARAVLFGDASLIPQEPVVDTITVAKRDLSEGEEIDGIGGHTIYGLTERVEVATEQELVPISLIEGATLLTDVTKDDPITYDDVELPDTELLHLRKLQDSYFNL